MSHKTNILVYLEAYKCFITANFIKSFCVFFASEQDINYNLSKRVYNFPHFFILMLIYA